MIGVFFDGLPLHGTRCTADSTLPTQWNTFGEIARYGMTDWEWEDLADLCGYILIGWKPHLDFHGQVRCRTTNLISVVCCAEPGRHVYTLPVNCLMVAITQRNPYACGDAQGIITANHSRPCALIVDPNDEPINSILLELSIQCFKFRTTPRTTLSLVPDMSSMIRAWNECIPYLMHELPPASISDLSDSCRTQVIKIDPSNHHHADGYD
jgi:hypothetical protein